MGVHDELIMVIDGETYTLVKASDVIRDGVALECWRRYEHEDGVLVAEAFWHDDTGKFTIKMPKGELPFVLVEAFLREAARWCPPSLRNDVGTRRLIYVPLVDEGVDVWRPVIAEVVGDQTFRIVGENISPDDEHWAFATGEVVRCEDHRFQDGSSGLVAVARND
jgi:hypothetical protein